MKKKANNFHNYIQIGAVGIFLLAVLAAAFWPSCEPIQPQEKVDVVLKEYKLKTGDAVPEKVMSYDAPDHVKVTTEITRDIWVEEYEDKVVFYPLWFCKEDIWPSEPKQLSWYPIITKQLKSQLDIVAVIVEPKEGPVSFDIHNIRTMIDYSHTKEKRWCS